MKKFGYKTLVLPFRVGIFKQGVPDIKAAPDAEGGEGWLLRGLTCHVALNLHAKTLSYWPSVNVHRLWWRVASCFGTWGLIITS